ncbi:MAG: NfeD family protein [Planctomycetota bacterium]
MIPRVLMCVVLLAVIRAFAGEAEDGDLSAAKTKPWIVAQDKGLSKGSFNPWKRGITLPAKAKIAVIPIDDDETTKHGMIDEWQANFVHRRLKAAAREKYDLVVIEIDSHGGELVACERLVKDIENSKVPVIAYVKNKALSAGAITALGCKMIVMQPSSEIGSAKIVLMGGDFSTAMRQKQDAYMRALVRTQCDQNGHPHALAQGMVDSAIEVVETSDTNQRFMTNDEFQVASKRGTSLIKKWKLKDQILALTAQEAVNAGLASGLASNLDEVALGMNAPGAEIVRMEISSSEVAARFLSSPWWRVALVIVGLSALFIEMKSPGHGLGYAAFAFCMGMFFWLQIFSNNGGIFELVLFGLGALLVALELFVLPTFGALGFAGISMVIVSIILAFLPEGALSGLLGYSSRPNEAMMRQIVDGMEWATLSLLSIIGFFSLVWWKGIALPGVNRMALNTVNAGTVGNGAPHDSTREQAPGASEQRMKLEALTGLEGAAETMLRPAGKVRLNGATYDAVSEGGFIEPGAFVRVIRAQGSALVVRKLDASS